MEEKLSRKKKYDMEKKMIQSPKDRHLEEVVVVRNIFCEDRCEEYSNGHLNIEIIFDIHVILAKEEFQVFYVYKNSEDLTTPVDFGSIFVKYLPPIKFYAELPSSYPTNKPPKYTLDIAWLPPWESSKICQKLDELWEENYGSEILFIWIDFLKNCLDFLNIKEKLDISYIFTLYKEKDEIFYLDPMKWKDNRVLKSLKECPIKFLREFDKMKRFRRFQKVFHFCEICLEHNSGPKSTELFNCKHIFCRNCIEQYISAKIKDGIVKSIPCPNQNCSKTLEFNEIKEICNEETFRKYDKLLLKKTLNTMKDVIPCARKFCQYPVIRDNVENDLATCANCNYSFCIYCRKVYHGVSPCEMSSKEVENIIKEYESASHKGKEMLRLKYGKKQIEIIVERHLTQQYLKENAKLCPNCYSQTTKIEGCNKMTCSYCQVHFCWLCGTLIELEDPYQHFRETRDESNACGGRLFDGVMPNGDILEDIDIEANLQFFEMRVHD